jgi:hypothetical protein
VTADDLPSQADLLVDGILEVTSPLSLRSLPRRSDRRIHTVQFRDPLTDRDYRELADWLADRPSTTLRAWGAITDLEFLRFFPRLQRFSADTFYDPVESFDGLRHLPPDLHSLALGRTSNQPSLLPLERFAGLRRLYLEGQTKDIAALARLTSLRSLTLRSVTLSDLSLLLPLVSLRALDLKLGGTRDLGLLPQIGKLEYLELWMVRGLHDLTAVSGVVTLQYLFLQALKQVTALPDLSRLIALETVHLETMKGLSDLSPLLTARALRDVSLVDMGHLQPADVGVLATHPALRSLSAGLNSNRKNRAVRELVPLPEAPTPLGKTADQYADD